jgi:hypothetical protein
MSGSIVPPGVAGVIEQLQNLVRATLYAAEQQRPQAFVAPPVTTLPTVTSANAGQLAFLTNGRNTGQAAGAGTGTLCVVNNAGVWIAVWSGVAPLT